MTEQIEVADAACSSSSLSAPGVPVGLAAFAGALAGEWDTIDEGIAEIVAERRGH